MVRPRVAVVTNYFPVEGEPFRGPTAYQTLKRLTGRWNIKVFSPVPVYPPGIRPRSFRYVRRSITFSPPGVDVHACRVPMLPVITRPINGLLGALRLLPSVRRFEPDLILNYTLFPEGHAATVLGQILHVPVVVGAIGSDVRRIPDAVTRWWTSQVVRHATGVIAVSEELRQQVIALGAPGDRTRLVLNGVDRATFSPRDRRTARLELGVPGDARLILFVGSVCEAKGIKELLEAASRLQPRFPTLRLVCVGEGVLRTALERAIAKQGLAGMVRFVGPQPSCRVAQWLAASDLLCLPSHSEGCPNVILESLACGRPVVATDVGGVAEIVTSESAILVTPRDVGVLSRALEAALEAKWDADQISRTHSRGWDQVADEVYAICMGAMSRAQIEQDFTNSIARA
jgi:teichuronic acid biosynthesis glycosyltransferase TuaC